MKLSGVGLVLKRDLNKGGKIKQRSGDLLELARAGEFDLIIHGCNCFCNMGAGIAKDIKQQFPQAYAADLATLSGDREKLGSYSQVLYQNGECKVIIVNAYTQYNWRGKGVKADYAAIKNVFEKIACDFAGLRIAYPLIGAGLAGGDWNTIAAIIEQALRGQDHTLVVLPARPAA